MILTVTLNPAVDHTINVDHPMEEGVVLRADSAQYDPGGKGINISKYLNSLDVDTLATGLVGGFLGDYIVDQLTRVKVPNDFVEMGGCTRLNTTILASDGEYKVNQSGHRVKQSTVRELLAKLGTYDPETVVVAGSLPPSLGPATIDRINKAGPWDTVVDVDGSILKTLSETYSLCKPNCEELADATEMPVRTTEECIEAATELRSMGYDQVIASLGADGAVLVDDDGAYHADALPTDVVDTVGAGDALLAGVLATRSVGKSAKQALRTGITVASRTVAVPGTTVPQMDAIREDAIEIPFYVQ